MYKDDYISAFGKLAPSEEWMTDTLAKMRAAEAEQEAPGRGRRPALRVSGKKHPRLRRAALPVAAAVALLAVPAAWFWGVAMRPAGQRRPRAVQPAERRGAADEGPGDGTGAPRRRSAGHSGHGKLCGRQRRRQRRTRRPARARRAGCCSPRKAAVWAWEILPSGRMRTWRARTPPMTCLPGNCPQSCLCMRCRTEKQRCARRWRTRRPNWAARWRLFSYDTLRPAGHGVLQPLCQRQGGRRKLFPKRAGGTFLPV